MKKGLTLLILITILSINTFSAVTSFNQTKPVLRTFGTDDSTEY